MKRKYNGVSRRLFKTAYALRHYREGWRKGWSGDDVAFCEWRGDVAEWAWSLGITDGRAAREREARL